jgi:hypothetical protein
MRPIPAKMMMTISNCYYIIYIFKNKVDYFSLLDQYMSIQRTAASIVMMLSCYLLIPMLIGPDAPAHTYVIQFSVHC